MTQSNAHINPLNCLFRQQLLNPSFIYHSAKNSLFAKWISSMLMFQTIFNSYIWFDFLRIRANDHTLLQSGYQSKRPCKSTLCATCHSVSQRLHWYREQFMSVSSAGITNGDKLAYSSKVCRRNRLFGKRYTIEDQGWGVAGKPDLDQGSRRQNPFKYRGV